MLIIALVLAVVSLAALVTAVVTSNELIAWVCIGFSALGVLLLIVDAIRDRHRRPVPAALATDRTEVIAPVETTEDEYVDEAADYPDDFEAPADVETPADFEVSEEHPDEVVSDEPDDDTPSDDEPVYPVPAEEAAIHTVTDAELLADSQTATTQTGATQSDSDELEQAYSADATIVVYSGEPYTDESAVVTESYLVISADETDQSDAVVIADETAADDSMTVICAHESDTDSDEADTDSTDADTDSTDADTDSTADDRASDSEH